MFNNSPYFNRQYSTLEESIADKFTYNYQLARGSIIDDFEKLKSKKPLRKSIDYVVNSVKEANASTKSVLVGNIGSAVINGSLLLICRQIYDGDVASMPVFLRKVSFALEVGLYTAIATPYFYNQMRKEGLSKLESAYQVIRFGATGGILSFTGYKLAKKELSEVIINETGAVPELALPVTQIALTYAFALSVALFRKPVGYVVDSVRDYKKTRDYLIELSTKTKNYLVNYIDSKSNAFSSELRIAIENNKHNIRRVRRFLPTISSRDVIDET